MSETETTIEPWRERMRDHDRGHLARFDQDGRAMTAEEYRKTVVVWEQKSGHGDKQTTVYYVRDKDDPDGFAGSQTTVIEKGAVDWHIANRYRGYLLGLYRTARISGDEMVALTPAADTAQSA